MARNAVVKQFSAIPKKEENKKVEEEEAPQVKEKVKIDSEAMQSFLMRNVPAKVIKEGPKITDMKEWKKKNRVDPKTKVFIIKGQKYPPLREALYERGWVENTDKTSPCFDLKWTVMMQDCAVTDLKDH